MKLKEWIEFNKPFYDGDLAVKVMKNKSYKSDDMLFETCAKVDVCAKSFGEYELAKFRVQECPGGGRRTVGVLLWVTA